MGTEIELWHPAERSHKTGNRFNADQKRAIKRACYILRCEGLTQAKIADKLNIDQKTVSIYLREFTKELFAETREEHRWLALDRIDNSIAATTEVLKQARVQEFAGWDRDGNEFKVTPDPELVLKAARQVVELDRERRKMLGLDEADKLEVSRPEAEAEEEIQQIIRAERRRQSDEENRLKREASHGA